jgi:tetratricopeptide (TPR) repeat protein
VNQMIKNAGLPGLGRPETLQMPTKHMSAESSQSNGTKSNQSSRFSRKLRVDHKMEWPSVYFCAIGTLQCYEWAGLNARENWADLSFSKVGGNTCMKHLIVFLAVAAIGEPGFTQEVESLIRQADQFDNQGETESAVKALKQADSASPENPQVEKRLSSLYTRHIQEISDQATKRKDAELAVEFGKKAVAKSPNDAQARIALAAAYGQICWFVDEKSRVEYSKQIYQQVTKGLELDPSSDYGHLILARWNFELATLNPVLKGIAELVYGQMPPASTQAAVSNFKKAIELAPQRIIHHAEYAKALEALGEKAQAREEWTKVTQLKAVGPQDRLYQTMANQRLRSSSLAG